MGKENKDWKNQLYFADNLELLKRFHAEYPKGFIDLIYIDPPFNSKRNYSVLFETIDMTDTKAQKEAFADTWSNISYYDTLSELQDLNPDIFNYLTCLNGLSISKGSVSYLTIMAIRIYYMQKLLKDTGSFYLHCDPTMSHYLKIICDLVFKEKNFRNEIIWHYRRWTGKSDKFQELHDIILFYTKSDKYNFNVQYTEYTAGSKGRKEQGVLHRFKEGEKPYLVSDGEIDEKGVRENDVWQIPFIAPSAKERLGYPTQKPEKLLERIINASSNKYDLVADFFCGCGTTIAVAQRLKRRWIGVDISHLAINLVEQKRLKEPYKEKLKGTYEIHGFPKDIDSAKELANNIKGGKLQFEQWIVEVMLNGVLNEKRNELGYDGYFTFKVNNEKHYGFIEVKGGHTDVHDVNHFIATVNDKKAQFGIFVCFKEYITRAMLETSKKQGCYGEFKHDKIQIISVEDLINGVMPRIPESNETTFKKATNINDGGVQTKLEM